jgi:glycosyltransferase involved in cell wall biosynthesis
VVSDRTSLPEVVGAAGLVVPAEDPGAWAEALTRALRPAMSADLVAAGRLREAEFRWHRSAAQVAALLGGRPSPRT